MRLHSPQWVAIAATLVVVGGSVTAGYLHFQDDKAPEAPTAADVQVQPGMEEAHAVATALGLLASKPGDLVATDVQSAVAGKAAQAVPKGATVNPNEASWHPDGLGGGTMTVTIGAAGQPTTTYSAIMIKERTGWKVVGTVPMTLAPTSVPPAGVGQAPAAQPPVAKNPAGTDGKTAGAGTVTKKTEKAGKQTEKKNKKKDDQ